MDILIKNMKMPKNYPYRLTLHSDGHVEDHTGYSGHGHYQAIELPPHGDLIERSSVYKVLDDRIAFYKEAGDEYNACNIACIEGDIVVMPTIIEASKETEAR